MKLYGKNPVIERLKANPKSIRKIYLQQQQGDASYIRKKAQQWGIPVFTVQKSKILKMARNANAQGVIVEVDGFDFLPFDELLEKALKKKYTIVFLDGLNDPQNLGAIIRNLGCLGRFALVLPTHDSVGVTEAVLRVASGGDNFVLISQVSNLNQAIRAAKGEGIQIAGAVVEDGTPLTDTQFSFPVALVMGSEQKGIRKVIRKELDMAVSIPMTQPRLSFNVAHATSIFCYEITRQKNKKK